MGRLGGGVAVVTGAGSGLGEAMVRAFATEGMRVVALDIDEPAARGVAESLSSGGVDAVAHRVDVGDRSSLAAAAGVAEKAFGACHVLCCNVGVQQFGAIDRLTPEDWEWVVSVNVLGTVNTVGAFLPLMRASEGDRHVLLTASSSVLSPGVRHAAYITSKFAVAGFGETLRLELAPEGIGVSILFPDGMSTRHLESSRAARPADLGPSITLDEDIQAIVSSRAQVSGHDVVTPEFAVRNLVEELTEDRPYIITHGNYLDEVEERFARVRDAFERMRLADARSGQNRA
jgi:NAD(P)-dependent dehydrogenase (short-subunit alcohol dehydrogenase family)